MNAIVVPLSSHKTMSRITTLDLFTKVRDSESVGGAFHLHIKKPGVRNNAF